MAFHCSCRSARLKRKSCSRYVHRRNLQQALGTGRRLTNYRCRTYANDSCAFSATGHGEFFIRHVVAYNICNRFEMGVSLKEAADVMVNDILIKAGGEGGVIAVDSAGNIAMPFNLEGMSGCYRHRRANRGLNLSG